MGQFLININTNFLNLSLLRSGLQINFQGNNFNLGVKINLQTFKYPSFGMGANGTLLAQLVVLTEN